MPTRRRFLQSSLAASGAAGVWPFGALGQGSTVSDVSKASRPDPARIALVIGNEKYKQSPLDNPANDAQAMAKLLRDAGFGVQTLLDLERERFNAAIAGFGERATASGVKTALFYYAGHAVQLDWKNWLLPVDSTIGEPAHVRAQCVDLSVLLGRMARAKDKTFLLFLDACRDNPFGEAYRPEHRGLSQFDAPVGSLIAFATAPGGVAVDGMGGKHGLYTEHLVRELAVRGARVEDALKRTRLNVRLESGGKQIPWESSSLESEVFLFPGRALSADEVQQRIRADMASWARLKNSRNPEDWIRYLREYPQGAFAEIAQSRLNALLAQENTRARGASITLGAGRAVPDFFGRVENPYSAGTYPLGRVWTVGDEATYHDLEFFNNTVQRTFTHRVTRVDIAEDRVEINGGHNVYDLAGNALKLDERTFEVPQQFYPTELYVGKRWRAVFRTTQQGRTFMMDFDFRIVGRERIAVPAGEFDTFKIVGSAWHASGNRLQTLWVVPGLNFPIRREAVLYRGGTTQNTLRHVLVSAVQRRA